ncbi:MAG: TRAP transporter large permease subunit, partial [Deltaproteobacteria bacterium]|nr:TRAP transporter large permease subunit [Deltaproteobacteria bacterium]
MSIEVITLLLFGGLILLLALGLPLAFVLGGVGMVGCYFLWGSKGLFVAAAQAYGAMGKFTLLAIPLFIFMAMILERAGVADDLYTMMHRWMGPLRGGLAIGTVLICTIFAAMSGISGAATVSMGLIALPAMLKRNYDKIIAMGCISGGGALGILIPPSVPMILYATLTGESVGGLFAGGVFPGLLLSALFILYIGIRCFFQPHLGPALPREERATWEEKFVSLKAVALPVMIILMVLGSIYAGVCTATEAAALGCLGAIISAAIYRKLHWTLIKEACYRTASLTTMIIWILIGAYCFTSVYTGTGAHELMEHLLLSIPGGRYAILAAMQITFFI